MEIKGISIQNKTNYYKILSVIRNNKDITAKEVNALNCFLNGRVIKQENISVVKEDKVFSTIRALTHRESYSFFEIEYK